jgi:hypothetical protein
MATQNYLVASNKMLAKSMDIIIHKHILADPHLALSGQRSQPHLSNHLLATKIRGFQV